jgi:hypothetical protein
MTAKITFQFHQPSTEGHPEVSATIALGDVGSLEPVLEAFVAFLHAAGYTWVAGLEVAHYDQG